MGNQNKILEEYTKLSEEYKVISEKIKELNSDVIDLQSEISSSQNHIKRAEIQISELQESIITHNKSLNENKEQYSLVLEELEELRKKQNELEVVLAQKKKQVEMISNKEICQRALQVNAKNTYRATLKKTTSTTPIITKFCEHKENEFLILNANMTLPNGKGFSYIVVRSNTIITGTVENIPTMTEIKSVAGKNIKNVTIPRMQYLKEHVLEVARRNLVTDPMQIIPLSEPCPIGGQSDFNQSGYGWEWDWSYGIGDYTEGTYYGEMTGFHVIGIQMNEPSYYF